MQHLAIDLGGTKSQICVRTAAGQILHEQALETARLGAYLKRQPASRVVLETCSEAFGVADLAVSFGHEVRVVPTTLVRSLGVGARRIKTDRRDAQVLSEVSCRIDLPSVHIPSDLARQRSAIRRRAALEHPKSESRRPLDGNWLETERACPGGQLGGGDEG